MRLLPALSVALVLLAGCGADAPAPAPAAAPAASTAAPAAPAAATTADAATLLTRANAALAADRLFAPAGDNAVELYLQAIEASKSEVAGDAGVRRGPRLADIVNDGDLASQAQLALNDLFPYGLIFVQQALQRDERAEAERVLALLERVQPQSAALQRLRDAQRVAATQAAAPAPARTPAPTPAAAPRPTPPAVAAAVAEPARATPAPVASQPAPPASAPAAVPAATPAPAATTPAPDDTASVAAPAAVAAPELINRVAPRYPERARRQRVEGWVAVRLRIDGSGEVVESQVVAAEPEGVFDREALQAAQRWRFTATGRESWVERQITFRLTD